VNFPKTLLLLLVMVAFVATGCGKSEAEKALDKVQEERKALLEKSLPEIEGLAKSSAELKAGNDTLKASFRQLDEQLITQSAKFAELSKRIEELNQKLNQTTAQLNAAEQKARSTSSFSLIKLLFIVLLVGLVVFVLVRLLRSRSEFEDEDDDYSDFEEDEDLGFEGDDDGGDDTDPSRKKPDTKKPDGDTR
jgi:flagellar biosynthesis/type III secretory pathway M-ring protein FliF/YscJ